MTILCCCDVTGEISCEFVDGTFTKPVWSDPDNLIVGGDIVGTSASENSRVTSTINFPNFSTRFIVEILVNVTAEAGNKVGFIIQGVGHYNDSIVLEGLGIGSGFVVQGKGVISEDVTDIYRLTLEYIIPAAGVPIVNTIINGTTIDSRTAIPGVPPLDLEGTILLTAYRPTTGTANILGVSVTCDDINFPGLVDCGFCLETRIPDEISVNVSGIDVIPVDFSFDPNDTFLLKTAPSRGGGRCAWNLCGGNIAVCNLVNQFQSGAATITDTLSVYFEIFENFLNDNVVYLIEVDISRTTQIGIITSILSNVVTFRNEYPDEQIPPDPANPKVDCIPKLGQSIAFFNDLASFPPLANMNNPLAATLAPPP